MPSFFAKPNNLNMYGIGDTGRDYCRISPFSHIVNIAYTLHNTQADFGIYTHDLTAVYLFIDAVEAGMVHGMGARRWARQPPNSTAKAKTCSSITAAKRLYRTGTGDHIFNF